MYTSGERKLWEFQMASFIVWTSAANVEAAITGTKFPFPAILTGWR